MNNLKQQSKLKSVLVFGAKDHIGSVVTAYIHNKAPDVKLRVATHKKENLPILSAMFPYAEAVYADFFDLESLSAAVVGMEGIFQISPDVFQEDDLVDNMTEACRLAGTVKHIIRILGMPPGACFSLIPEELKAYKYYPAMQHLVAKERYEGSRLPVTFVNVAGYYMDDFIRMFSPPLFQEKTIRIAYDKRLAWIDHVDVAEVSAELLLHESTGYKGTLIDLTGQDLCKISEVAEIFSDVLGTQVFYDGDETHFYQAIKPVFTQLWGSDAPEYFMKYFKWETEHDHLFKLTPHVRCILGRDPKSFKDWINENRGLFTQVWQENKVA
ncbi:MAG: NmrA family NAD(P)-binding protein [Methylococcaceae bacterium]|jgi:uncharacterized protein YbjT (DUF2867 family)